MLNIWFYVAVAASAAFFALPATGFAALLLPAAARSFTDRYRALSRVLMGLALFSQLTHFWLLWGLGMKYVERPGPIKTMLGLWHFAVPLLFAVIFWTSVKIQSRRDDVRLSLAFYSALTLAGPLYFLAVKFLELSNGH